MQKELQKNSQEYKAPRLKTSQEVIHNSVTTPYGEIVSRVAFRHFRDAFSVVFGLSFTQGGSTTGSDYRATGSRPQETGDDKYKIWPYDRRQNLFNEA
ncbi:hypothetical protein Tco_0458093 [Tanacetum coccineum]